MTPRTTFSQFRTYPGLVLAIITIGICALWLTTAVTSPAHATVRAPDNAVNSFDDPNADGPPNTLGHEPVSSFWRALRHGVVATAASDTASGKVIQSTGEDWRLIRRGYILKYSGWVVVAVVGLLMAFYLLRGQMKITGGRTGKMIARFDVLHRIIHWFIASIFLFLGLSGFIIMLGRPVLVPIIGHNANAVLTSAAMQGHNLFGPMFIFGLIWMFFKFVPGNILQLVDFKWILSAGGLLGKHVSSSKFNFGEKSWFWLLMIVGAGMSATGLLLEFPWLIDDLRFHQLSTILHAIGAVTLLSVAFGHIYVGSIGMEGALDAMVKGEVDENWAKEHHDLWYEEVTGAPASPAPVTPKSDAN